ncbi:MAG TPA: alpha/beta fold hydrolase [Chlamydiales bacterium]|nr:alpha/beta fold hydrolase [Chlamydiales bacterium]
MRILGHTYPLEIPSQFPEKMRETALKIPRTIFANFLEVALIPVSAIYLLISLFKSRSVKIKKDQPPILLLHGSGSNGGAWTFGRQFLKKREYGSVFSPSYDGKFRHDFSRGIEDHALGKIRREVLRIKELTGKAPILIGTSMGGMVAAYYAEHVAPLDGIKIEHVMTITSPLQGAPILKYYPGKEKPKRYQQMSVESSFRQELAQKAFASDKKGVRKYYSIGSTADFKVPDRCAHVTEEPERKRTFSYLGHDGLMVSVRVWLQVRSWLDTIYAEKL